MFDIVFIFSLSLHAVCEAYFGFRLIFHDFYAKFFDDGNDDDAKQAMAVAVFMAVYFDLYSYIRGNHISFSFLNFTFSSVAKILRTFFLLFTFVCVTYEGKYFIPLYNVCTYIQLLTVFLALLMRGVNV